MDGASPEKGRDWLHQKGRDWLHQKGRRLGNLKARQERLESDMATGCIRLCFGARRLWRKQYALEANGYSGHEEWLKNWRTARIDEFFVLGSKDETEGCQLCVTTVDDDGSLTMRLRMPDALAEEQGKYPAIRGVRFKYDHERLLAAVDSNAEYASFCRKHGEKGPVSRAWTRPSVTGSSGMARAGGSS